MDAVQPVHLFHYLWEEPTDTYGCELPESIFASTTSIDLN